MFKVQISSLSTIELLTTTTITTTTTTKKKEEDIQTFFKKAFFVGYNKNNWTKPISL